uniref:Uncharacterized protein n=1 Tax=Thuricola similis TaxID=2784598 RepID=A0A7T8G455_9CILI|nr:hypothetical protein K4Z05_mgp08 [Thuricola similis]QQP22155.1 hypothetical protein TSIM_48 [Thuricola similis]
MLETFKIKYRFKQYPTLFKINSKLSLTQKISRQKAGLQHRFEDKFINTLMRKGNKLKILHLVNKWWIKKYRIFFRYLINIYTDLTFEEISKKYLDKAQFIEFLKKNYIAWSLSDVLYFRLNTLLSIFQIKQYQVRNLPTWSVRYLPVDKRLHYVYSLFILYFRANRLLNKKLLSNFDLVFVDFIRLNDTYQEVHEIKLQAYKQFLF